MKLDLFVCTHLPETVSRSLCWCELCPESECPTLVGAQSPPSLMGRLIIDFSGHLEDF